MVQQVSPVKLVGPPEAQASSQPQQRPNSTTSTNAPTQKPSPSTALQKPTPSTAARIVSGHVAPLKPSPQASAPTVVNVCGPKSSQASATTLLSSTPCLDFFFSNTVPAHKKTTAENLTHILSLAWNDDPSTTLKLICHLRKTGRKSSDHKESFYAAALWLHKYHPKTLASNLNYLVNFGYFKDLPEILYRLLEGLDVRSIAKKARVVKPRIKLYNEKTKKYKYVKESFLKKQHRPQPPSKPASKADNEISPAVQKKFDDLLKKVKQDKMRKQQQNMEAERLRLMEKARSARKEKRKVMARKAFQRYTTDPDFRLLHDSVSQVFADRIVADLKFLKSGQVDKISLASKWCPSLNSSFDRSTLLCENIAKRVFPRELYPQYQGVQEAHYSYRVRDRLRKECLVPLRQALQLPEVYMSSKRWSSLPYDKVPSGAFTKYKKLFLKHDKKRFTEFLRNSRHNHQAKKITAAPPTSMVPFLPHEMIRVNEGVQVQWRKMVEDLSNRGKLRNSIAVCDLSKGMNGTPMDVCIALGLLISELTQAPWKDQVFTFSQDPMLRNIEGNGLKQKIESLKALPSEAHAHFQKLFDKILQLANNRRLRKDQMLDKIFVFSNTDFDSAAYRIKNWDIDYKLIQKKFAKSGFEVPQVVFWNLTQQQSKISTGDRKGVKMVSGFSKNMVKLILDEDELVSSTQESPMNLAIRSTEFNQLVVLD